VSAMVDTTREPKYCAVWRAGHKYSSYLSRFNFACVVTLIHGHTTCPECGWRSTQGILADVDEGQ
jgi:hypothetical protein